MNNCFSLSDLNFLIYKIGITIHFYCRLVLQRDLSVHGFIWQIYIEQLLYVRLGAKHWYTEMNQTSVLPSKTLASSGGGRRINYRLHVLPCTFPFLCLPLYLSFFFDSSHFSSPSSHSISFLLYLLSTFLLCILLPSPQSSFSHQQDNIQPSALSISCLPLVFAKGFLEGCGIYEVLRNSVHPSLSGVTKGDVETT